MPRLFLLAASALALGACSPQESPKNGEKSETYSAAAPASTPSQFVGQYREAPILGTSGRSIGTVRVTEGPKGVLVNLRFDAGALSPGWHGVHFHKVGGCDDGAAGFTHSGSHIGSAEGAHGLLNPNGPEPGDLPSIFAPASGAFEAELYSPFLTISSAFSQDRAAIDDEDGGAFIVHAARDDHTSQPIGGAGARVGCAVFTSG